MPAPQSPAPQSPAWLDGFALPGEFSGAVIALDLRPGGLWAARVGPDGELGAEAVEPRIVERTLDLRIAARLRPRHPEAGSREGFAELVRLAARARARLLDLDSVMMLGDEHIRLLRLSLDDVRAATAPEVNRAHGMVAELAGPEPVDAILLGPGGEGWPGLWESLTDRGYTVLHPGDPFPATFGGDDGQTSTLDAVAQAPVHLAWGLEPEPGPEADDLAEASRAPGGEVFGKDEFDEEAFGEEGGTSAPEEAGEPGAVSPADRSDDGRRGRKQLLFAVLAIGVIGGAAVALGLVAREVPRPAPETPDTAAESSAGDVSVARDAERDQAPPTRVEPAEIREARETMLRYTSPTPTTTEAPPPAQTAPAPAPRPTDNRRTIPNPIPGLPPIVIG